MIVFSYKPIISEVLMMKLITRILLIFLVAISFTCSAKEYVNTEVGISFEIPQGFSVIDPKVKDPRVTDDFYALLKKENAFVYLYNMDKFTEVLLINTANADSRKAKDYFYISDHMDSKTYNTFKDAFSKKMSATIDNVSVRTTYAAKYVKIIGHNKEVNIKSYITIKNGETYGINANTVAGKDTSVRDYALQIILSSIKYHKSNIYSDTKLKTVPINSFGNSKQGNITQMLQKGVSGFGAAVVFVIIYYLGSYIWGKIKGPKKEQ